MQPTQSATYRPSGRYTAAGLHDQTRTLHQPRILWLNAGWVCVGAAVGLALLGVMTIATTDSALAVTQLMHLGVGLLAAAIAAIPHFRLARDFAYPLLGAVTLLLVFVLIPWVPESIVQPRNGARRWIDLKVTDFQPSELAKIAYVLALASYLRYRRSYRTLFGLLAPLALTFLPMGLILVEPDLGTAMLFLPTFFAMLIAAGAKLRHLVLVVAIGLASAPMLYPVLQPHQKNRIRAMVAQVTGDPQYEHSIGFQGAKAMMLVGAGGVTGVGKEQAAQLIVHNGLPEHQNDMIFAVVCCRWGVLGAVVLWTLQGALIIGGLLVAGQCKDPFGRLTAVGLVSMLFAQAVINMGMTIGLLPIAGMTLPFVSAGGSSLLGACVTAGLLLNIGLRRSLHMSRESFDFDDAVEE